MSGDPFDNFGVYCDEDKERIKQHPELARVIDEIRKFLNGRAEPVLLPEDLCNYWDLLVFLASGHDMRDVFKCENEHLQHRYGPKGANLLTFGKILVENDDGPGSERHGGIVFYLKEILGRDDLELFLENTFESTKDDPRCDTYLILTQEQIAQRRHEEEQQNTKRAIRDAQAREKHALLMKMVGDFHARLKDAGLEGRASYEGQGSSRRLVVWLSKNR